MTKRRVKAYDGLKNYKILVPNWLFFSLENNKEAIKNMYTVLFAIERVVLFKDVHGVAFYCDMDHCCNYTKKKKKPMTLKLFC